MEPREQIALTIQLPVEELGRLSRLLDQVRQLMAADAAPAGAAPGEAGASPAFDEARFQSLAAGQRGTQPEPSELPQADAVRADLLAPAEDPLAAESPAQGDGPAAPDRAGAEIPPEEALPAAAQEGGGAERPEAEAPVLPSPGEPAAELSAPGAGYEPAAQPPQAPGGSWGNIREELAFPGPAPLTAEAVSLAFQRDDRRYDNGFPLY